MTCFNVVVFIEKMWCLKQPIVGERCFCMVDKISENELKMSSKSIQKPAQKSSTILSKIEVNSEEGLISCGQVWHDTPGVKFARKGGDLGGFHPGYFPTRRRLFKAGGFRFAIFSVTYSTRVMHTHTALASGTEEN